MSIFVKANFRRTRLKLVKSKARLIFGPIIRFDLATMREIERRELTTPPAEWLEKARANLALWLEELSELPKRTWLADNKPAHLNYGVVAEMNLTSGSIYAMYAEGEIA